MKVFCHHIYEYKKELRLLILHTMNSRYRKDVELKLISQGISFLIHDVTENKMNIYFGKRQCVEIVRKFNKPHLSQLTCEEDFILGTMLGYGLMQQCDRFLNRSLKVNQVEDLVG